MLCPYGNEVGEPARRADCPARVDDGSPMACYCEAEMALLDGRQTHDEAGVLLIDPQTFAVQQWWIEAETSGRDARASAIRSGRPTI